MDRARLNMLIEREVHKLMSQIGEHVHDFVHVYVMRNKLELDRPTMLKVLEIVKLAIQDGFQSKIAFFNEGVDKSLEEFTLQESPLDGKKKGK